MIIEFNEMNQYLKDNSKKLLSCLVDHQQGCPIQYNHENNIAVGLSYEECVSDNLDRFIHKPQEFDNYVKRDLVYVGTDGSQLNVEFKSAKSNIHKKTYSINYTKKNGNESFEVTKEKTINTVPDALIFYQKFDLRLGIPAVIGLITKDKLIEIMNGEGFSQNKTNVYLDITINDFDWHITEKSIPMKREGYYEAREKLDRVMQEYAKIRRRELSNQYETGLFFICDCHEIEYMKCNGLKKEQKSRLENEIWSLHHQGKMLFEISKQVKVNPETVKRWLDKKTTSEKVALCNR